MDCVLIYQFNRKGSLKFCISHGICFATRVNADSQNSKIKTFVFYFIEVMILKYRCENARGIVPIFHIAEGDGSSEIADISCNRCFG